MFSVVNIIIILGLLFIICRFRWQGPQSSFASQLPCYLDWRWTSSRTTRCQVQLYCVYPCIYCSCIQHIMYLDWTRLSVHMSCRNKECNRQSNCMPFPWECAVFQKHRAKRAPFLPVLLHRLLNVNGRLVW